MGKVSISISQSSPKTIYRQIEDRVRSLIVAGELNEGEELPSIRMLAQDLRVSVLTVKRAYDDLEAEGFLTSVQGKGCYVSCVTKSFSGSRGCALWRRSLMRRRPMPGSSA